MLKLGLLLVFLSGCIQAEMVKCDKLLQKCRGVSMYTSKALCEEAISKLEKFDPETIRRVCLEGSIQ